MPTTHFCRTRELYTGLPCSKANHPLALPLYVTPPAEGEVRVRRLVHRGAPRPVYKYRSLKLGRTVQCESALEVEVAQLLDASPEIEAFAEQPVQIHYGTTGQWRAHVPDFVVRTAREREFVEVKYENTIDDEVRARTVVLEKLLGRLGWGYRLLTEAKVKRGAWLSNARLLLRRGQEAGPAPWSLHVYERVRVEGFVYLSDFGWLQSQHEQAGWIASEVITGKLWVDRAVPVTAGTRVCPPKRSGFGRTLPW